MGKTISEYKKTSKVVEKILKTDMRARSDDKWLIYRVMSHYTRIFIPFEDFKKIPAFGTITRVRRMFNQRGMYLPSENTQANRRKRESEVREWSQNEN